MANPNMPSTIPAFKPPTPDTLESDDAKEARETAAKIEAGKLKGVTGYTVGHDAVGPWSKGDKLTPDDVTGHFKGHPETADFISRLIALGALVPSF